MTIVNETMQPLVVLVAAVGLVWSGVVWKSSRRTAALVAVACALQLAVRLLWMPAVRFLFGPASPFTNPVQRSFALSATALSQLSLAASLGLLVYAALRPAGRQP